ncbi:hypothetical protein ACXR0O_20135 [Verrucomicrobiota bacterium sgz303538]
MRYYFRCPNCGNDERFVTPHEQASNLGCALLFFGGLLPALVFANYTRNRVQCLNCGYIFRRPPLPSSPLATFAGWIVAVTLIPCVIALLLFASPEIADSLPSFSGIAALEEAIALKPRLAAYLLVVLVTLILAACWAAALVSSAKFRKQLSGQYRLTPDTSRDAAHQPMQTSDYSDEKRSA